MLKKVFRAKIMTKYIIGNWKMNKSKKEAMDFANELKKLMPFPEHLYIGIAPPFPYLEYIVHTLKSLKNFIVYAQNVSFAHSGAYTGEVSAFMVKDVGSNGVIIGHSERRHIFKENPDWMALKIQKAIEQHLKVILCVGETEKERTDGQSYAVLNTQLESALGSQKEALKAKLNDNRLVIAYEPVWAIGTGKNMEAKEASEYCVYIKKKAEDILKGYKCPVLYGGSVNLDNISKFASFDHIDGVLVGGASLKLDSFIKLIQAFF